MNFKQFIINEDRGYCGIPTSGGYSCNSEYEIGAATIAEALHCILGSAQMYKIGYGRGEVAHMKEEIGIIKKTLSEYSRSIYTEQLQRNWVQYMKDSVESIRSNRDKLKARVDSGVSNEYTKLPNEVKRVAKLCFDMLNKLADVMFDSVKNWPAIDKSAFSNYDLRIQAERINVEIEGLEKLDGNNR